MNSNNDRLLIYGAALLRGLAAGAISVLAAVYLAKRGFDEAAIGVVLSAGLAGVLAGTIFGMLMHEGDERLSLLPGAPPSWVAGEGLSVSKLPTAHGELSMAARQDGKRLRVTLDSGLAKDTTLQVYWPSREKPARVTVDGKSLAGYDANGIRLDRPFKELVAEW